MAGLVAIHHARGMRHDVPVVLTTAEAGRVFGIGRTRWMVQSGRWQRPFPGVIVRHSGPLTHEQTLLGTVLSYGPTAALAGLTAAEVDGLTGFPTSATHLLLPHGRKRAPQPGVVVHRTRLLTASDVHPTRLPRRTRLPRSIIDAASWTAHERVTTALIAASVQQRLVRPPDLTAVVERMTHLKRRALICEVIRDVSGGSQSGDEVAFLRLCRAHGLPVPTRQRKRNCADGQPRYTDAEFDDYDLVVEIDGRQHIEIRHWWDDMNRQNDLAARHGKWVLRFPGFIVRHHSADVAARLADFFRRTRPDLPIRCACTLSSRAR